MAAKRRKKAAPKKKKSTRSSKPKRGSPTSCMGCVVAQLFCLGIIGLAIFAVFRLHWMSARALLPQTIIDDIPKLSEPEWLVCLVVGVGYLVAGFGVYGRRLWGLYLFIVLSGFHIGLVLVHAFREQRLPLLFGIVESVLMLIYLLWSSVRSKFV